MNESAKSANAVSAKKPDARYGTIAKKVEFFLANFFGNSNSIATIVRYLLIFLIILGIANRVAYFGSIPQSLYVDEVSMATESKFLADTAKDSQGEAWLKPIFYAYGDFKLSPYIYATTLTHFFIEDAQLFVRLPSLLAGLATIFLAYLFALELLKQKIIDEKIVLHLPLVFAAVISLSPTATLFSRTGFEGHLAQFFLVLSAYFYLRSFAKNVSMQRVFLFLAATVIFGSLSVYTYFANRFVWPVIIIALSTVSKRLSLVNAKHMIGRPLIILMLASALTVPMLNSQYYKENNIIRYSVDSVLNNWDEYVALSNSHRAHMGSDPLSLAVTHRYMYLFKDLAANMATTLSPTTLFVVADQNLRHSTAQHGSFLLIFFPFFIIGFIALRNSPKLLIALSAWVLFGALPAAVPHEVPHALRSLNIIFPLGLIISMGLSHALRKTSAKNILPACSMFLLLCLSVFSFSHHYFQVYSQVSANYWAAEEKELTHAIHNKYDGNAAVVYLSSNDKLYLWWIAYDDPSADYDAVKIRKKQRSFTQIGEVYFQADVRKISQLVEDRGKVILAGDRKSVASTIEELQATYFPDKELGVDHTHVNNIYSVAGIEHEIK